jgi:hypothetical protein
MVIPLTMPLAYDIAEHLCASHRDDVLREHPSVWSWASSAVEKPGTAWALVGDKPLYAGGVQSDGDTGVLWLAGVEGWTRYVKHALKIARAILSSGAYKRYSCEVSAVDVKAQRFAERLGFVPLRVEDGLIKYEVTP